MEFKTDALLLRAADYGEYDKIVTLFTAERGKITASMKGVKRAGAKLRFAAQPFCFAEYVFASGRGRNTVISATLHEGFYGLRESVETLYAGFAVTGVCDAVLFEGMENPRLLLEAVHALTGIAEGGAAGTDVALLRFLLTATKEAGYPVSAGNCPVCGANLNGRMRFDPANGCFTCADCSEGAPASESTYRAIRAILYGEGEPSEDGTRRALRLVKAYLTRSIETELPALSEYLALRD